VTAPVPEPDSVRIHPEDWLRPLPLSRYFPRPGPLEVDVGCGKGRFLLARARAHPQTNFLGIDRMLRRIRKIDGKAVRGGLANLRLLRVEAYYATLYLLPDHCVYAYYVFFPDPWPKKRHARHRLFNAPYLDALDRTLVPGGRIHVATDHAPYFEAIRDLLAADDRFREAPAFVPDEAERTDFERYYIRHTRIGRCSFERAAATAGGPAVPRAGPDGPAGAPRSTH
jgi:tRNA (guanine-N7-)-methyltransferase